MNQRGGCHSYHTPCSRGQEVVEFVMDHMILAVTGATVNDTVQGHNCWNQGQICRHV